MSINPFKNTTKQDLFVLAQIFAILSGTFMVVSAMFSNQAISGLALRQEQVIKELDLTLNYNLSSESLSNLTSAGNELSIGAFESVKGEYNTIIIGVIFAILAIFTWFVAIWKLK